MMAEHDWPYGYAAVVARDAQGQVAVPTRVGLRRTSAGLLVAAECDGHILTFPLPAAAKFAGAIRRAISQHTEIESGGIGDGS